MGVFETLEKNSLALKVTVMLLVVICAGVVYSWTRGPRLPDASLAHKEFYSDDDGKSWFLDDVAKDAPFDHGGKPAYRALVFRCGGGRPFVAFLAKFSDQQKAQAQADLRHSPPGTESRMLGTPMRDLKKPGASTWETNNSRTETGYPEVKCPDGNGTPTMVHPVDSDTGATN